jgi:hypothetical protein
MKLKAKYHEVYYRDIYISPKTYTVWAWYNFKSGYGIIKSYVFDHSRMGMTSRHTPQRLNPRDTLLFNVAAENDDVHAIIETAIRIANNAGKTWGLDDDQ